MDFADKGTVSFRKEFYYRRELKRKDADRVPLEQEGSQKGLHLGVPL